jgi:hypothetical protein
MAQGFMQGGCSFDDVIELADINVTENASRVLNQGDICIALFMHSNHNWGDATEETCRLNDEAFKNGGRVISSFVTLTGVPFVVATELGAANSTTIALSEELELCAGDDV